MANTLGLTRDGQVTWLRGQPPAPMRLDLQAFTCGYCRAAPGQMCWPKQRGRYAHADRWHQLESQQIAALHR